MAMPIEPSAVMAILIGSNPPGLDDAAELPPVGRLGWQGSDKSPTCDDAESYT